MGLSLLSGDAALKDFYVGRPVEQLNNSGGLMDGKKKPMGKLGSGQRFKTLQGELARKGARDPAALSAWIGRKNLGKARFSKLSQAGKKRHEAE